MGMFLRFQILQDRTARLRERTGLEVLHVPSVRTSPTTPQRCRSRSRQTLEEPPCRPRGSWRPRGPNPPIRVLRPVAGFRCRTSVGRSRSRRSEPRRAAAAVRVRSPARRVSHGAARARVGTSGAAIYEDDDAKDTRNLRGGPRDRPRNNVCNAPLGRARDHNRDRLFP
jgi:hypothetical protein